MRTTVYLRRIVALAVLAAWSVAVNLRERVATPADGVRRPTSTHAATHTGDDRLRWN